MITIPPVSTQPGRRTWVAIALSLLSPSLGMMYLGRGRRALCYFIATFAGLAVTIALAANGHWKGGVSYASLNEILTLVGIVDCYRIARSLSGQFSGPWYSRWHGIAGVVAGVTVFILCLRGFVIEPYRIPGGSMTPALRIDDLILVKKWEYGVRMPFVHNMLIELGSPRRGDVIVFRIPFDPGQYYVKRVVGLPGDRVQYADRTLVINAEPVERRPKESFVDRSSHQQYLQFEEHLGEANYSVIYVDGDSPSVHPAVQHTDRQACTYAGGGVSCTVPPQSYFVIGDNRDNSEDSRYWGFVPVRNIAGKVSLIWWNERSPDRAWTAVK
jgi:signal peptidase I